MNSFTVLKKDEQFIVEMYIDDHMKHIFDKHKEDDLICNGSSLCNLLNVFIYHNKRLNDLWYMFDFDYNENELRVYTKDEDAFISFIREIIFEFNDIHSVESLVESMVLQKRYYGKFQAVE